MRSVIHQCFIRSLQEVIFVKNSWTEKTKTSSLLLKTTGWIEEVSPLGAYKTPSNLNGNEMVLFTALESSNFFFYITWCLSLDSVTTLSQCCIVLWSQIGPGLNFRGLNVSYGFALICSLQSGRPSAMLLSWRYESDRKGNKKLVKYPELYFMSDLICIKIKLEA